MSDAGDAPAPVESQAAPVESQAAPVESPAPVPDAAATASVEAGKSSTAANMLVGTIKQMDPADQEAIKKELCTPAPAVQEAGRRSKRRRQKKSAKKSKKGGRSRKNCGSKNRRKYSRRR